MLGTAVDFVVSLGPTLVLVPDFVGLDEAFARAELLTASLEEGTLDSQDFLEPAGQVLFQSLSAGVSVAAGSRVDLIVSRGATSSPVPSVLSLAELAGRGAVTTAGFAVGVITTQFSDTIQAGRVIAQSPQGGTIWPSGGSVGLVISSGLERLTVPNVVTLAENIAAESLTEAGLKRTRGGSRADQTDDSDGSPKQQGRYHKSSRRTTRLGRTAGRLH
ncbi:MAG: PASTA domain-containing protein [Deltaproteobacteria bacterium]|nr:PASTA domain-containing protein [Deltaproteobacteria bacterium]